ncbi:VIR protein [Plasmodium vivax]|uniref:VIR protein n=1 Tax=Plasmodium vivax TaxID=5855 RepID=A0A1G4GSF0_PLAVI|nr:VIR protein [Plasmodium vivax]
MVTKSAPATIVSGKDLEKDATALDLHILHKDFFVTPRTPSVDTNCSLLDSKKIGAKNLCNNVVHFLKEIAKKKGTESYQRCSYLPYWLYDEIAKIHEKHNEKISTITFIKDLTEAVNKAKKGIPENKCTVSLYDPNITLDDWKKRKITYIYFNKHDAIKSSVNRPNNDKCSQHFKYLNSFYPLYQTFYKQFSCVNWFPSNPDYFKCSYVYNPDKLLTTVKKCSTGSSGGGSSWPSLFSFGSSSPRASQSLASGTRQGASSSLGSGGSVTTKPAGSSAASPLSSQSRDAQQLAGRSATSQLPTHLNGIKIENEDLRRAVEKAMAQSGGLGLQGQMAQMVTDGSYVADANSPEGSTDSVDFLKKAQEFLKSDNFRHSVVGASAIGVFIFFFYFFISTQSGRRPIKREKSRRKPEYNYYDPNEEAFSRYGSEHSVADSEMSDVNLSYHPRRDRYR